MRRDGIEHLIAEAVSVKQGVDEIETVTVQTPDGAVNLLGQGKYIRGILSSTLGEFVVLTSSQGSSFLFLFLRNAVFTALYVSFFKPEKYT